MAEVGTRIVTQLSPRTRGLDDSRRIQNALDEAASRGGGVVRLEPGTYVLDAPLRLSAHTVLESALGGERARLVRGAAAAALMAEDADYGEKRVVVQDGHAFRVGMGVAVRDDASDDWLVSTAVIDRIVGNELYLDRRLVYDYDSGQGGRVESAASMIEAVSTYDVAVRNVVLDGSGGHAFLNGCRGGAIYFYDVRDSEISGVEVGFFNGDGISWQITDGILVTQSVVHHTARYGFHPGTGAERTRLSESAAFDNGSDGLYLCWRVQGGVFEKNRFSENRGSGISIGHKDTDNQFLENVIMGNHLAGVRFRAETESNGGHRNLLTRNVIQRNGQTGIWIEGRHREVVIHDNYFDGQEHPVWATEPGLAVQSDVPVSRPD